MNTVHDDHKKVYMVYNYIHNKLQSHENCYHNQQFETLTVLCQICMAIPLICYIALKTYESWGMQRLTFLGFLSHLEFSHRASPSISWGLRKHCLARSCQVWLIFVGEFLLELLEHEKWQEFFQASRGYSSSHVWWDLATPKLWEGQEESWKI